MKWAGLLGCSLLVVTWAVTHGGGVFFRVWPNHLAISAGGVRYLRYTISPNRGPEFYWMDDPLNNMSVVPSFQLSKIFLADGRQAGPDWQFDMPFWCLLLLAGVPTYILWRRDRVPEGYCKTCYYDLTGNESGVCPECGTKIEPP